MGGQMDRQQGGSTGQHTGMKTQGGQGAYPVDNLTFNLISVLHTKLEGLEAYQKYLKDAQGDQECQQLFQQLQQQDTQAAIQIQQHLQKHFSQHGSRQAQ